MGSLTRRHIRYVSGSIRFVLRDVLDCQMSHILNPKDSECGREYKCAAVFFYYDSKLMFISSIDVYVHRAASACTWMSLVVCVNGQIIRYDSYQ